jgi:hypothetical protein
MRGGLVLTVVVVAAWYAAARALWDAARMVPRMLAVVSDARVTETHADSAVSVALRPEMAPRQVRFSGDFESPFKPSRMQRVRSQGGHGPAKPAEPAVKLTLNGILLRARVPHAILGDEQGGTHVRAEGDSLFGYVVAHIGADKVVLRRGRSTMEVYVEQ